MKLGSERIIAANELYREKEYWKTLFSGFDRKTTLLSDRPITSGERLYKECHFTLRQEVADNFLRVSNGDIKKLYSMLVAAVIALLHKMTDETDLTIGMPVFKQNKLTQLLNNALALRFQVQRTQKIKDTIVYVHRQIEQAIANQNYPVLKIPADLGIKQGQEFSLFDVAVVLSNIQDKEYLTEIHPNILFVFDRNEQGICGCMMYNSFHYDPQTANNILDVFHYLLDQFCEYDNSIQDLRPGPEIVMAPAASFPLDDSLVSLFRHRAELQRNDIAVTCGTDSYTFAELDDISNRVAGHLQRLDWGNQKVIGLALGRSCEYVAVMLGIIKSGAIFLPLDPDAPANRNKFILEESKVTGIIANDPSSFTGTVAGVVLASDLMQPVLVPTHNPDLQPESIAYIIYTSGTTGRPKGVMVRHRNIINHVFGLKQTIWDQYPGQLNLALISNFIFDASVQHLFGALLLGHRLVIATTGQKADGEALLDFYNTYNIHISDGAPVHVRLLNRAIKAVNDISLNIGHFIIGGDVLYKKDLQEFYDLLPDVKTKFTNVYGPTECTVNATAYEIDRDTAQQLSREIVPIGTALPNYRILILNKDGHVLPKGISGEIYIGGEGLSAGYVNAQLNKNCFITSICGSSEFWYKTGDWGFIDNNEQLHIIGRNDSQLKIRGYRVELNEVKENLLQLDNVKDVILKVFDDEDEKYICAYLSGENAADTTVLRAQLATRLPAYMIPAFFVWMEKYPCTSSGKVDMNALPYPKTLLSPKQTQPVNELQRQLLNIWKTVLKNDHIGCHDNFFHVGGDSIRLIILLGAIKEQLNATISLKEIYGNETVVAMAALLEKEIITTTIEDDILNELQDFKLDILNNL